MVALAAVQLGKARGVNRYAHQPTGGYVAKGLSEDLRVKVGVGQAAAYLAKDAALDGTHCPR